MSLLGVDVGTTGCKAVCFSSAGQPLATAYREYDVRHPYPGWAELDTVDVWQKVQETIREAVGQADVGGDRVRALAVSSLGEAVVPVSRDREILGPSILNFDVRGEDYLPALGDTLSDAALYAINGNTLGNHYGLTKLMWIRDHRPELYENAYKFLPWSSFVGFMLGADAVVDYSLANRLLLFDLAAEDWSEALLAWAELDREKLPRTAPSGALVGTVSASMAEELGLDAGVRITTGAHDQCANAVGCGVIAPGQAVYGMGTFICVTPVFTSRPDPATMIAQGLNTEHHAVPGRYVSFIYNQGGSLVKWFRDTFAAEAHRQALAEGRSIYDTLFAELPDGPSGLVTLPYFTTTGPPEFVSDSRGVIAGLSLETSRGAILAAIVEGATFYLRACIEGLPKTGIGIRDFRATGGGSQSDRWLQRSADILGRPMVRPTVTEAGALGAAILAGVGSGHFDSFESGIETMVGLREVFTPDPAQQTRYAPWFDRYQRLWPLMRDYLQELATAAR
ncbi:MAG: FGGY-family carbohydrate kinase [Anaerolineae bacterium]